MKMASIPRKGQVYSVGNYLMTGKVLGKGHFARVEEATHRIIGKKVAIKIIDLTCIKEEYARRNLHREPRVMAKLRHPCIAALYETMMHGPRLYVVMEAAGGGDLCTHVLTTRGVSRGLPEARARALAAQLVSAVRHMHARGVVHRDLKMENIMLDSTKQFIKIVDFGLSNVWNITGALCTPCGSLEYAAPELFVDGRRYGPEVDLWSIGVIVYGMVTGSLPFTDAESKEGQSRPQLRAAISRGFTRKQRAALACASSECKTFVQHLLEPNVELRMKIEEAARHRWIRKPGMRMKTHPLAAPEAKINREIFNQVAEVCGQTKLDVITQIKADPFGPVAGIYNIKTHLHQMHTAAGVEMLWSTNTVEPRPLSPPEYRMRTELDASSSNRRFIPLSPPRSSKSPIRRTATLPPRPPDPKLVVVQKPNGLIAKPTETIKEIPKQRTIEKKIVERSKPCDPNKTLGVQFPGHLTSTHCITNKIVLYDSGDCTISSRLPSIEEHSNSDLCDARRDQRGFARGVGLRNINGHVDRNLRLAGCPSDAKYKRSEIHSRAGDGLPSWRASCTIPTPPARLLIQSTATGIKRASLGNIISPHSSTNSHCKSERAVPVSWFPSKSPVSKETAHAQRIRRTAPMK
ncbi:hormonally up-regulated neu tumor-associated kinase-like [Battus philenor]|uniref:hormonally up-regulated neu tumor-associated kinase-like n=1 Tax=Battus philenor TaxID=42288 RepID=UPI0035CFDA21